MLISGSMFCVSVSSRVRMRVSWLSLGVMVDIVMGYVGL